MSFEGLGLHPNLLKGIRDLGYTRPTPVQSEAIPPILTGRDVIASAQTGTGKTAAFVLPILHRLMIEGKKRGPRALIVAPTRELALQSMDHLKNLSRHVHLKGCAIFGGVPINAQTQALRQGVDIISATPGRLLDHVYQGHIQFGGLEILVLDEADRMMDMGFLPDVKKIISYLPPRRQNLVFSATIPAEIMSLAHQICRNAAVIQVGIKSTTPAGIRHAAYPVSHELKTDLLLRLILKDPGMDSVLIFTRTKSRANRLAQKLDRARISVSLLHGDRSQAQRLQALEHFRQGRSRVLVATDIAARGIDIKDISHVINFDVPSTPEDYIHRIGRTGRVDAVGAAFSLVTRDEEGMIREIEREIRQILPRITLPDFDYSKSVAPGTRAAPGTRPRTGHYGPPSIGGRGRGRRRFGSRR